MIIEREFYIGYRDIDKNLSLKNSSILTLFEDIAGIHSAMCGEGLMQTENTWLVTAYKVKIRKKPVHGDTVRVATWVTQMKNIFACREFEMRSQEGELLVCGISNWVHINMNTHSFVKISDELISASEMEVNRTNFGETKLKKLKEPLSSDSEKELFIDFRWIDLNRHMNNVYYMDAAMITLPQSIAELDDIGSFEIMYKKEILENAKIRCFFFHDEQGYTVTLKSEDLSTLHSVIRFNKDE